MMSVSTIPVRQQKTQSGKKDPTILNEGAGRQPVDARMGSSANQAIRPRFEVE